MKIVKTLKISEIQSDIRWVAFIATDIIRDIMRNGRTLKYTGSEYTHVPNFTWKRSDIRLIEEIVAAKESGTLLREKGCYPRLPTAEQWPIIDEDWAWRETHVNTVYSPDSPRPDLDCARCGLYFDWCICFEDCK